MKCWAASTPMTRCEAAQNGDAESYFFILEGMIGVDHYYFADQRLQISFVCLFRGL